MRMMRTEPFHENHFEGAKGFRKSLRSLEVGDEVRTCLVLILVDCMRWDIGPKPDQLTLPEEEPRGGGRARKF
jgi:hypothetical protein